MNLSNTGQDLNNALFLYIDGASRNNPGQAGCGLYIEQNGISILKVSAYLGIKTSNQAEYCGLLLGLLYLKSYYIKENSYLIIKSDSLLLVNQLNKRYKVKNQSLMALHAFALDILKELNYSIYHIPRSENKIADKLANIGIEKKISIAPEFLNQWHNYEKFM